MNIEIDIPRRCSAFPSFNSSRRISVNFTTSFMDDANQVQAQTNNLTWTKQVENGEV